MKDVISDIDRWLESDQSVIIATVVETWGSAPRKAGAKMAFTSGGKIAGSVSGGCVEGAVFESGVIALENMQPELLHFGVADETAWEVGLACGGTIEVFVQPLVLSMYERITSYIEESIPFAHTIVIKGPNELLGKELVVTSNDTVGSLGIDLDTLTIATAREVLSAGTTQRAIISQKDEDPIELFVDVFLPEPVLVLVGGVHIAIDLIPIAEILGYQVVVIDPRKAFGTEERFPNVSQLVQAWPDEAFKQISLTNSTAVAMLTHDPKIDDPSLKIVLESDVFYIGALGSKKTHAKRIKRLQADGFTPEQINRIHGPIGLTIGGHTPGEIALAVMAEITSVKYNKID